MESTKILKELFQTNAIRLNRGSLFDWQIPGKQSNFDFKKVEGMLLGIAIGDSLGVTTEGMLISRRKAEFGEIRDYLPHRHLGESRGFPSDDTQLAFWTLEQLIEDQCFIPENVVYKFSKSGRIFGIGSTVHGFLKNLDAGYPWYQCGPHSAGNGALMRIAPILIPHLRSGGTGLWVDTALASMMTHNDEASTSACLAFVAMLWELLDMSATPENDWWVHRYVELARDLEGETSYSPRSSNLPDYRGPVWRYIEEKLPRADSEKLSVIEASRSWYSGAYLLETIPSVLYILMRHASDPEEAIVRAVNDTKDNDTIAAIVGAAVGALHGKDSLPERWISKLSGRTSHDDDGKIFELIDMARITFWHQE